MAERPQPIDFKNFPSLKDFPDTAISNSYIWLCQDTGEICENGPIYFNDRKIAYWLYWPACIEACRACDKFKPASSGCLDLEFKTS